MSTITNKENLLKQIAEDGYNIGFGACKSFATYDIVNSWLRVGALLSLLIGIAQLKISDIQVNNKISLLLIFISIIVMHITYYIPNKDKFNEIGKLQLGLFYKLKDLYYTVRSMENIEEFSSIMEKRKNIYEEFTNISDSNEIFILSDIYAHIKFFGQKQIDWVDEQKNFSFWKDKFPNSVKVISITTIITIGLFYWYLYC